MKSLAFLDFQIKRSVLRLRWLLPLPVFLFIAYYSKNGIQVLANSYNVSANVWAILLYALGNSPTIYLALTTLFLFLVCDLVPEPNFEQWIMLRLGSRCLWWREKILTLCAASLCYTTLVTGIILLYAGLSLPWQNQWSGMITTWKNVEMGLPKEVIDSSPLVISLQHVSLLALGWIGIGMLTITVSLWSQRWLIGYLAGCVVLLSGYIDTLFVGSLPTKFPYVLMITYHLEYTPGWIPQRNIPFSYSLLYWLAWIIILGGIGVWINQRQDHLARKQRE